jgi:eukaryotic-like serine/threonine-protein kinase
MERFPPGTRLAQYTILGKLAQGGMAEVYLARLGGHSGFAKTVVLKVIHAHLADEPRAIRMFENEAKLAASLNHPNIAQVFDFNLDQGVPFIAMEYVDGKNLNGLLRARPKGDRKLPPPVALRILTGACGGLAYAHGLCTPDGAPRNVVHRDVSLENIIVTYSGQVKLVDFGLAKATDIVSHTTKGTLKGKYRYMAPEMLWGEELDHRVDIYALGVVFYRILLGRMPFSATNHAELLDCIVRQTPPAPRQIVPSLPAEVERIVMRALEKKPDARQQSTVELQAELEAAMVASGAPVTTYKLAQYMDEQFPPGTDDMRATYIKLKATIPDPTPVHAGEPSPRPDDPRMKATVPNRPQAAASAGTAGAPAGLGGETLSTKPDLPSARSSQEVDPSEAEEETRRRSAATRLERPSREIDHREIDHRVADEAQRRASREAATRLGRPAARASNSGVVLVTERAESLPTETRPERRLLLWGLIGVVVAAGGGLASYGVLSSVGHRATNGRSDGGTVGAIVVSPDGVTDGARALGKPDAARSSTDAARTTRDAGRAVPDVATQPVIRPRLAPRGFVSVNGASHGEVYHRGRRLGGLPLRRRALAPGRYTLTVRSRRLGYQLTRQVVVRAGAHASVEAAPRRGRLKVLVRPWARVYLDGKDIGLTPIPVRKVYEGPHRLRFHNSKLKRTERRSVVIRPEREAVVKIRLE